MNSDLMLWADGFEGPAKGGYFIRNDLFKFIKMLRDSGLEPVGLKIEDGWNLEVIVKVKEEDIVNNEDA